MSTEEIELTKIRTNFYCVNYRRMVVVLLVMLLINFALIAAVFYNVVNRGQEGYFATSQNGTITQIYTLSEPIKSPQEIIQWAGNVAPILYSYNFVNYNEVLQQSQKYFTPDGWIAFKNIIQDPKTLEPITSRRIVVSSVATSLPKILHSGVLKGYYFWDVQIPMLITYQSPTDTSQQPIILTIRITRTSTFDVAISDITAINQQIEQNK